MDSSALSRKQSLDSELLSITEILESLTGRNSELLQKCEDLEREKEGLIYAILKFKDRIESEEVLLPLEELINFKTGAIKELPYALNNLT